MWLLWGNVFAAMAVQVAFGRHDDVTTIQVLLLLPAAYLVMALTTLGLAVLQPLRVGRIDDARLRRLVVFAFLGPVGVALLTGIVEGWAASDPGAWPLWVRGGYMVIVESTVMVPVLALNGLLLFLRGRPWELSAAAALGLLGTMASVWLMFSPTAWIESGVILPLTILCIGWAGQARIMWPSSRRTAAAPTPALPAAAPIFKPFRDR